MQIQASIKNLRIGPRKVRLLTRDWCGQHPEEVITRLSYQPYKAAEALIKLLKQAVANAVKVHQQEKSNLTVAGIQVGDAFSYKRMDRSHGARFDRGMIKKRGSNVYLTLASTDLKQFEAQKSSAPISKIVSKIVHQDGPKS